MQRIELNLDKGGMKPIVEAFEGLDYNQNFKINLIHERNKWVEVEKYPLLCSIVNEIKQSGNTCNIDLNCESNCDQLNYAERMGFLSFMDIDYDCKQKKWAGEGRFIEIENITNYYYPGEKLLNVFQKDFNFTFEEAHDISVIFSEIANNCVIHSKSYGGCVLYCQKYPKHESLNLFIVDSGIGIFKAMQSAEKYRKLNELQVLKKSFEYEEGNGEGYGQGLFLVCQFIKRNLGYLRLVTGNYLYVINNGIEKFDYINTNYKGVVLNLGLPFDIKVTINDLMYEQINNYGKFNTL